jgi:hypothetical protein
LKIGKMTNIIIGMTNDVIKELPIYTWQFTTEADIPANGEFHITIPEDRIWVGTGSMACTEILPSAKSVSCTIVKDASNTYVTKIVMTGMCSSACTAGTFKFQASGSIKNPDYVKPITVDWTLITTDSSQISVNLGRIYV